MKRLAFTIFVAYGCGMGSGHDPFVGCSDKYTPEEEFSDLEDRTAIDCGTHEFNYPVADPKTGPSLHYCGPAPNTACVQDAIAGDQIAHLVRVFYDPESWQLRERHYFGGDGSLVYMTYFENIEPVWYRYHCTAGVDATSYEVDGMTCWKVFAHGCEQIK